MSRRPRKRHPLRNIILIVCIFTAVFWLWPEHVTIVPPEGAPAATANNSDWNLTLVNKSYGLPEGYTFSLAHARDGVRVDRRIARELSRMLDDAEAQGYEVHLNAGYRTSDEQRQLFEEKQNAFRANGYDDLTAQALAAQWVSPPGASEHELGLAVDIGTETTALYDWLAAESWRYGFIRRYPPDKTDITGVAHEPWHFRYVGKEAAAAMASQNLCLEEYVNQQDE